MCVAKRGGVLETLLEMYQNQFAIGNSLNTCNTIPVLNFQAFLNFISGW